jgi:hypothetical protein
VDFRTAADEMAPIVNEELDFIDFDSAYAQDRRMRMLMGGLFLLAIGCLAMGLQIFLVMVETGLRGDVRIISLLPLLGIPAGFSWLAQWGQMSRPKV